MQMDVVAEPMTLRKAYETRGRYPAIGWYMTKSGCTREDANRYVEAIASCNGWVVDVASLDVDSLCAVAVGHDGCIFCVGDYDDGTRPNGLNGALLSYDGLLVKYDCDLNILARKIHRDNCSDEFFTDVVIDASGDIVCVGYTDTNRRTHNDCRAFWLKYSRHDLSILAKQSLDFYSTYSSVMIDNNDNIICIGNSAPEGYRAPEYCTIDQEPGVLDTLIVEYDRSRNSVIITTGSI